VQHLYRPGSRSRRIAGEGGRFQVTCGGQPHHLTRTTIRPQSPSTPASNDPPLRTEDDRQALIDGLRDCTIRLRRHGPRSARRRGEGGALRRGGLGVTGWRPPSPLSIPTWVVPGVFHCLLWIGLPSCRGALGSRRRASEAGRGLKHHPERSGAHLDGGGDVSTRAAPPTLPSGGRELTGRGADDRGRRSVASRQRSFAAGGRPR